jgi:hypothetical protein
LITISSRNEGDDEDHFTGQGTDLLEKRS